jgi:uncharacterized membrane protein
MSRFNKITLTIIAAVLLFVGPTYVPAVLTDSLKVEYVISITLGAVLFIVGLALLVYLIRKKVIT